MSFSEIIFRLNARNSRTGFAQGDGVVKRQYPPGFRILRISSKNTSGFRRCSITAREVTTSTLSLSSGILVIQISGFEGQLVVVKGAVDNSVYAITESDPPLQMPQKIPISTTDIRQYASPGDMNVDLAVP